MPPDRDDQSVWLTEKLTRPFQKPFLHPTRTKLKDVKDPKLPLCPYLLPPLSVSCCYTKTWILLLLFLLSCYNDRSRQEKNLLNSFLGYFSQVEVLESRNVQMTGT